MRALFLIICILLVGVSFRAEAKQPAVHKTPDALGRALVRALDTGKKGSVGHLFLPMKDFDRLFSCGVKARKSYHEMLQTYLISRKKDFVSGRVAWVGLVVREDDVVPGGGRARSCTAKHPLRLQKIALQTLVTQGHSRQRLDFNPWIVEVPERGWFLIDSLNPKPQ